MKVIVLGGAGDMGSQAVEDLAATSGVQHVTIADKNVEAAEKLARQLAGAGATISVRPVDADSHHDLVEAMSGHDVAASALGPFYRYEPKLVQASLDAGVDYASICDDWIAAQNTLDTFDEPARKQGLIVLTGIGASPGVSNVVVRYFAEQMERPRKATICVFQPPEAGKGMAVLKHVLFIFGGRVPTFRNGRTEMIPACSMSRMVEFPGVGPLRVYNVGHAEPVTIPRFMPGIEEVNLLMGMGPGTGLFVWLGRLRLTTSPTRIDRIAGLMARLLPSVEPGVQEPDGAMRIELEGDINGQSTTLMLCGKAGMRPTTGFALSLGAQALARREILVSQGGVYAPEAAIEPAAFLRGMISKGLRGFSDIGMTQEIVV